MLTMYARLRGVPDNKIKDIVSDAITLLNLGKWADSLCGNYRYNSQWSYLFIYSFHVCYFTCYFSWFCKKCTLYRITCNITFSMSERKWHSLNLKKVTNGLVFILCPDLSSTSWFIKPSAFCNICANMSLGLFIFQAVATEESSVRQLL